ncbi:MAG: citrate transporter [Clostridia bacterium]|nr:citrate transporter [Clostridia bacterium]
MLKLVRWIKSNFVLSIAFCLALITAFIVPPDSEYVGYFDFKTLACLFCTLAVICALKNIRFFTVLARTIVHATGNLRSAVLALVFITFFGSMLIANDMALITFLPLGYYVLSSTGKKDHMAFVFVMQNIAANLGGMLTPFGNPQNLYLYSHFEIPTGEFVAIMLPPFLAATVLIVICCLFVKPEKIDLSEKEESKLPPTRTVLYLILFAVSISVVFHAIPYLLGTAVVLVSLLVLDRKALLRVDYGLLLTFTCFFVFAGNLARVELVHTLLSTLLEKSTLLISILSCQVISNVPSAILLSRFTADYPSLLLGVNIGGTGTLIASLASLITFREYSFREPYKIGHYLKVFTLLNLLFLVILTVVALVF